MYIYLCTLLNLVFPQLNCTARTTTPTVQYSPTVTIPDGILIGSIHRTTGTQKTYYAYRGIPYAKPPVGPLRFAPPQKNDKWSGCLNATYDKDICPQFDGYLDSGTESNVIGSEDCLHINVYTPKLNNKLPVMVWVHGGGLYFGSSNISSYNPEYLLEKDIVFVSFNYRLGVLGFLSTEDLIAPGNWGIKDQAFALKWVKENIQYFGGDPEKVTIFGESAGGASVSYLLQSKLTTGLFRAAIIQSGSSLCGFSISRNARKKAFELGARVGINETDPSQLIAKLREVDYKKLRALYTQIILDPEISVRSDGFLAAVVVEPEHNGSLLSQTSYNLLKNGQFNHVPVMIGFTSLEATKLDLFTRKNNMKKDEPLLLSPISLSVNKSNHLKATTEIRKFYFNEKDLVPDSYDFIKWLSVEIFVRPIRQTVNFLSKYTTTYLYEFSYKGDIGQLDRKYDGVSHFEEVFYLFKIDLDFLYNRNFIANAADALTRERLITLWTNFAKFLNPTPAENRLFEKVKWEPNTPTTDVESHTKFFNINASLTNEENPYDDDWKFYTKIFTSYGGSNYYSY